MELEPPEHTRLRGLVNRAFVSRQIDRLAPRITDLAHAAIDRFAPRREADLIGEFAAPIPIAVIADLIGAPPEATDHMLDWSHAMVAMYAFGVTRAVEDAAAAAARDFSSFVRDLIAERRRAPRDDLVSRLIEAEAEGGKLSQDELVTTLVLLLNAGHEASVHAIGNGLKALLEAGAVESFIAANPEARARIVDEGLRFDPPLHLFTRFALQDVEMAGVALRKGDQIGLLLGAANRDAEVFPDPDRLVLDRARNPHVAFGAGIHFCVGAPLARLELRVAMSALLQRLPGLALSQPPRYRDSFHFHGLESLRANW